MLVLSDSLPNPTITSLDRNFPQASKVRCQNLVRATFILLFSFVGLILIFHRCIPFPISSARTLDRTYPLPHGQASHPIPKQRHFRSRGRWTSIL
jgi:hypothetical protein